MPNSVATRTLAIGQSTVIGVNGDFAGAMGSGGWPVGKGPGYAWRVDARVQAIDFETVVLSVTWRRHGPGNVNEDAGAGDTRVLRLSAGQRHVLDFVQSDDADSPQVNLLVEVEAGRATAPSERAVLDYDFWLVHEDRSGTKTTRHLSYGGFQGEKMPFAFAPLGFALDGTPATDAGSSPVSVSVNGGLTGRLRPDGDLDVVVDTEAWMACGSGRTGGGGAKTYVARIGETVSVEVPTAFGWCTIAGVQGVPSHAKSGVTATGAGLRVSSREFFEGDRFSILVTVKRMR